MHGVCAWGGCCRRVRGDGWMEGVLEVGVPGQCHRGVHGVHAWMGAAGGVWGECMEWVLLGG